MLASGHRALASHRALVTEITLLASDGLRIAGLSWKRAETTTINRRILALHGWMDNAATYHYLAPYLIDQLPIGAELVAIDFIGHGHSSHKSIDGGQAILAEGAYYVAEAVDQLEWNTESTSFTLVGHSMGAAVGCLYAAAFPEQVERLVLLEGVGPLARNPRDVAKHVRSHVQRRMLGNKSLKQPRIYDSLQDAIQVRCKTAQNFPGDQYLSTEAAMALVQRGTRAMGDQGGVQFRHDPRLTYPSLQYFTLEQTEALYQDIQCPTCLLLAKDGWPFDEEKGQHMLELLQPVVHETLPGSHHFHADPESSEAVAKAVLGFLSEEVER